MPFLNEHSARLQNPDKFDPETFRRNASDVFGKKLPAGVGAIWAKFKNQSGKDDAVILQAIRFPKDKYTVEQAKKWLEDNNIKYISFEAAKNINESDDLALVKDLKDCSRQYSDLKIGKKIILSESEILEDSELIIKEMLLRGKQKFTPENWKNKSIELYGGIFNKLKKSGVSIPESVEKFLPGQGQGVGNSKQGMGGRDFCWCPKCKKNIRHERGIPCIKQKCPICGNMLEPISPIEESKHKRDECMKEGCEKKPLYEALWAEGMGHAWFCESDFKEWVITGDGKGDIVYVKEIKEGKASNKFSENTNPNIWEELRKTLKEQNGLKIENWTSEILAKETEDELANRLKGIYELWTITGAKEFDEEIMRAYKVLINEFQKRKITYEPIAEFEKMIVKSINMKENRFTLRIKYNKDIKESILSPIYELLIDTGREHIEKFKLGKDILKESEIPVEFTFININTPDGKDFKEWMGWQGELPSKINGGSVYGNLTESILNIEIKDSGTFEIIESTDDFRSVKFNGKVLNGYWIMESRKGGWILLKGQDKSELKESSNVSITGDFVSLGGGFTTTDISYNGKVYTLSSTGNGKLILTKD